MNIETELWLSLERIQPKLDRVPVKQRRFSWENIANLRGAFRKGPNGTAAPIEAWNNDRLFGANWELLEIEQQIDQWLAKESTPKLTEQQHNAFPKGRW